MILSIIMTFKNDHGLREQHFKWTLARYKAMLPNAEIIVSEDRHSKTKDWEGFCKSKFINRGVNRAQGKYLLITDIDIILPKESILKSIELAERLDACVVPYDTLCKLTHGSSSVVLSSHPTPGMPTVPLKRQKMVSLKDGRPQGISVISKDNFIKCGGYDERFIGWGSEDSVYQSAAMTLCTGGLQLLEGISMHLWHPIMKNRHQDRDQRVGTILNQYKDARFNVSEMQNIIANRYK